MKKMNKNQKTQFFASLVRNELSRAEARDAQDVGANRAQAIAAYRNAPLAKDKALEDNGLSTVQSSDIADMISACLSQITPMLTTDCAVQFEPTGQDDEDSARAESQAVDNIIQNDNRGYTVFYEAFHDALLLRNGWIKVFTEETTDSFDIPLEGDEDPEMLSMMLAPKAPGEERSLVGEDGDEQHIKVVTTTIKFMCEAVPAEDVTYAANEHSTDVEELRFVAQRIVLTRSQLVDMGYDRKAVYGINLTHDETNIQSQYRNTSSEISHTGETPDQEGITCHEAYIRADCNNDGIAELYKVFTAGDEGQVCLGYEEVEHIPFATGTPFIRPHRITGESLFDRLNQTQTTKTGLLRTMLDNARFYTYGRWAADPAQTTIDDILNASPVVRSTNPAGAAIPIMQPDFSMQLLGQLEYQDKVRVERGGASLDMAGAEMQIAGETAHGMERQVSLREMLTAMMARNLAETLVRRVYQLMHDQLRMFSNAPLEMKMHGEWQSVDPRQWKKRNRLNVKVGLSAGEKSRKVQALSNVIQMQISAIQNGYADVLTDEGSLYNSMADWAYASDLDNPDSYLVSPNSKQAQAAKEAKQKQEAEQQQMQITLAEMQATQLQQTEQIKVQGDLLKQERELAHKYWSDRLKSETEEAKIVATGTTELNKVQLEGAIRGQQQNGADRSASNNEGNSK